MTDLERRLFDRIADLEFQTTTLESRTARIEKVLVALARAVHSPWGLRGARFRPPGAEREPSSRHKAASPFEAIADLIK